MRHGARSRFLPCNAAIVLQAVRRPNGRLDTREGLPEPPRGKGLDGGRRKTKPGVVIAAIGDHVGRTGTVLKQPAGDVDVAGKMPMASRNLPIASIAVRCTPTSTGNAVRVVRRWAAWTASFNLWSDESASTGGGRRRQARVSQTGDASVFQARDHRRNRAWRFVKGTWTSRSCLLPRAPLRPSRRPLQVLHATDGPGLPSVGIRGLSVR
jgi:hypothetical protein